MMQSHQKIMHSYEIPDETLRVRAQEITGRLPRRKISMRHDKAPSESIVLGLFILFTT